MATVVQRERFILILRCTAPVATRLGVTQAVRSAQADARRVKPSRAASTSIRTTGAGRRSDSPPSWHGALRSWCQACPLRRCCQHRVLSCGPDADGNIELPLAASLTPRLPLSASFNPGRSIRGVRSARRSWSSTAPTGTLQTRRRAPPVNLNGHFDLVLMLILLLIFGGKFPLLSS